jgi:hypothetical protein
VHGSCFVLPWNFAKSSMSLCNWKVLGSSHLFALGSSQLLCMYFPPTLYSSTPHPVVILLEFRTLTLLTIRLVAVWL